jgi:16S rRNA (cytidine1402-2'-O)-methyltransferase
MSPSLYLVPTPIGNLEDITLRAIRVLKEVDVVLAEDTRNTGMLLKHLQIAKPLQSHHAFNEHQTLNNLVERMKKGERMALVSDAGTPAISDPGFLLVRACLQNELAVECLPGPTAFVPALVKSGLPCDRFTFEGFLPQKKGRPDAAAGPGRRGADDDFLRVAAPAGEDAHATGRVLGTERLASVSRELTKLYEETVNGTLAEIIAYFTDKTIKGEIVIVVDGKK